MRNLQPKICNGRPALRVESGKSRAFGGFPMHSSRAKAYFNHAGLSRPGPAVVERMRAAAREYNDFLFSEAGVEMYYAMLAECRRAVAAVMGLAGAGGVSLLAGASSAVQLALSALGAALVPGDLVLTSDQ